MLFSKWTILQLGALAGLIALAFIAETFSINIGYAMSSGTTSSMLVVLTFILLGSSLIHLFFIFHSKKSERFLSHPLWNKMNVLTGIVLVISVILVISGFLITSVNEWMMNYRWNLYGIVYYFLFLYSLFVLSIVHKMKKDSSKETKIEISFGATVVTLCLALFLL